MQIILMLMLNLPIICAMHQQKMKQTLIYKHLLFFFSYYKLIFALILGGGVP